MADSLARAKARLRDGREASSRVARPPSKAKGLFKKTWFLRLVVYGGLLIAWQIIAVTKGSFYLPTLQATIEAIGTSFTNGYYWTLLDSLRQMFIGFGLSLLIALPVGALMGRFRVMEDLFAPYVSTLYVTSKEALLPLVIIAFGTTLGYRVAVVVLFSLFFPIMNTAAGVRFVDKNLIETARAFCTSRWRLFTRIYLPGAAPFIVAGIRLGLGMALKGMVIAELWVLVGTGELLSSTGSLRQLDIYFAVAIGILVVGVCSNEALKALERRLRPYSRYSTRDA